MMARIKRGVQMTASARKALSSWRTEASGEDATLEDDEKEASRNDWDDIQKEVEAEKRKLRRTTDLPLDERQAPGALAYDEVAGDGPNETEEEERLRREAAERAEGSEQGDSRREGNDASSDPDDSDIERVLKAKLKGENKDERRRGGQKYTGSQRKRRRLEKEKGKGKGKGKDKDDDDRWVRLRLAGEEKEKRIDATRVVHYHCFDEGQDEGAVEAVAAAPSSSSGGDFRSAVRRDLWEDSDEE
eukprot:TRINITY_DN12308_c0_g1_i1.p1 TRINITY_DN12308_c0_g1~~TRINITY_DN12308_c0_g1_i1.p1  ORF type:complete len:245 (+),score=77.67 TRINITY_DN12308_c0_g1_i1:201-935(+)